MEYKVESGEKIFGRKTIEWLRLVVECKSETNKIFRTTIDIKLPDEYEVKYTIDNEENVLFSLDKDRLSSNNHLLTQIILKDCFRDSLLSIVDEYFYLAIEEEEVKKFYKDLLQYLTFKDENELPSRRCLIEDELFSLFDYQPNKSRIRLKVIILKSEPTCSEIYPVGYTEESWIKEEEDGKDQEV